MRPSPSDPAAPARSPARLPAVIALLAGALLVAPPARAHGLHEPISSAPTPPSPPGDGATAEKLLAEVEAKAKELDQPKPANAAPSAKDALPSVPATDGRAAKIVAEPVKKAREALERARGARSSGDAKHAADLDGLALEWAEMARDLLRAAGAEDATSAAQKKAQALETQVERARTLLEETQARRGRAAAELERVETESRDAAKAAAAAEDDRTAAGVVKKGEKGRGAKKAKAPAKKKVAK